MIEQTIDYLNTRTQFGVQLSSFQALRHRLVDMYVAYENARGMVRRLVERGLVAPPLAPGLAARSAVPSLSVGRPLPVEPLANAALFDLLGDEG